MTTRSSRRLRVISAIVAAVFFCQEIAWADLGGLPSSVASAPMMPVVPPISINGFIANPGQLDIPFDAVTLQEIHPGTNGKLIIHIQDAHANLSGQQSLAKALEHFLTKYGLKVVLVEGADRDVTLDPIRKLAPLSEWKIIARRFLYEGIVSGEEYLNLTSEQPMKLRGVEYQDLYNDAVRAYASLVDRRKDILHYLYQSKISLDRLKARMYPQNLLDYEKKKFGADPDLGGDFKGQAEGLFALCEAGGMSLADYPQMTRMKELFDKEKSIDFDRANREQASVLSHVEPEMAKSFAEASRRLRSSQVSQYRLIQQLLGEAGAQGLDPAAFPALAEYAKYLERFLDLKIETLMTEQELLEDRVFEKLLPDDDARKVRAIDRFLGLLGNAYKLQMSSRDFKMFEFNEKDFPTESWLAFMNRKLADLGFFESMVPTKPYLEEARADFGKFYNLVGQRDEAFVQNAHKIMAEEKTDAVVLIAGGYHTDHLTELLRAEGTSYIVLTPLVTDKTDQGKYEEVLLGHLKSQERRLAINASKIASDPETGLGRAENVATTRIPRGIRDIAALMDWSVEKIGDGQLRDDFMKAHGLSPEIVQEIAAARMSETKPNHPGLAVQEAVDNPNPTETVFSQADLARPINALFSWLPRSEDAKNRIRLTLNSPRAEVFSNPDIDSPEGYAEYLRSLIELGAGESGSDGPKFDAELARERSARIKDRMRVAADRYLTAEAGDLDAIEKSLEPVIESSVEDSGVSGPAREILIRNIKQKLKDYRVRWQGRSFEGAVEAPAPVVFSWKENLDHLRSGRWGRVRWAAMAYRVMRSDVVHVGFSGTLWLLIASMIGGPTLGVIASFLAHFVLAPVYDGAVRNLESRALDLKRPPIFKSANTGKVILAPGSGWKDIRQSYHAALAHAADGEELTPALRVYVLERLIRSLPELQIESIVARDLLRRILSADRPPGDDQLRGMLVEAVEVNLGPSGTAERAITPEGYHLLMNAAGVHPRSIRLHLNRWQLLKEKRFGDLAREQIAREKLAGNRVAFILLAVPLKVLRVLLKPLNLDRVRDRLLGIENRLRLLLGRPAAMSDDDLPMDRSSSQEAGIFEPRERTEEARALKELLLREVSRLDLSEESARRIESAVSRTRIKYGNFVDNSWTPLEVRIGSDRTGGPVPQGECLYDMTNQTLVLSSNTPPLINAAIMLKFITLSFEHQVILGKHENVHLPDPSADAIFKRFMHSILKDSASGRTDGGTAVHLFTVAMHALWGRTHSYRVRPGILTARRLNFVEQALVNAREGFVVSAYLLFGRKHLATTDQPSFGVQPVKQSRFAALYGFLKPIVQTAAPLGPALVQLFAFVGMFGGLLLHMDLGFINDWLSAYLPDIGLQFLIDGYLALKAQLGDLIRAWFGYDLDRIREILAEAWQAFGPAREFVQDTVIPIFYQMVIPAVLFFWGLLSGYSIHKKGLGNIIRSAVGSIVGGAVRFVATPIKQLAALFVSEAALKELQSRIDRSAERTSAVVSRIMPPVLSPFLVLVSFALYAFVLVGIAFPPANLRGIVTACQTFGLPLQPIVLIGVVMAAIGVPYSKFWDAYSAISSGRRSLVSRIRIFKSMLAGVFVLTTVIPSLSDHLYKTSDWFRSDRARVAGHYNWRTQTVFHSIFEGDDNIDADLDFEDRMYDMYQRFILASRHDDFGGMPGIVNPLTGRCEREFVWPKSGDAYSGEQAIERVILLVSPRIGSDETIDRSLRGNAGFFNDLFNYVSSDDAGRLLVTDDGRKIVDHLIRVLLSSEEGKGDFVAKLAQRHLAADTLSKILDFGAYEKGKYFKLSPQNLINAPGVTRHADAIIEALLKVAGEGIVPQIILDADAEGAYIEELKTYRSEISNAMKGARPERKRMPSGARMAGSAGEYWDDLIARQKDLFNDYKNKLDRIQLPDTRKDLNLQSLIGLVEATIRFLGQVNEDDLGNKDETDHWTLLLSSTLERAKEVGSSDELLDLGELNWRLEVEIKEFEARPPLTHEERDRSNQKLANEIAQKIVTKLSLLLDEDHFAPDDKRSIGQDIEELILADAGGRKEDIARLTRKLLIDHGLYVHTIFKDPIYKDRAITRGLAPRVKTVLAYKVDPYTIRNVSQSDGRVTYVVNLEADDHISIAAFDPTIYDHALFTADGLYDDRSDIVCLIGHRIRMDAEELWLLRQQDLSRINNDLDAASRKSVEEFKSPWGAEFTTSIQSLLAKAFPITGRLDREAFTRASILDTEAHETGHTRVPLVSEEPAILYSVIHSKLPHLSLARAASIVSSPNYNAYRRSAASALELIYQKGIALGWVRPAPGAKIPSIAAALNAASDNDGRLKILAGPLAALAKVDAKKISQIARKVAVEKGWEDLLLPADLTRPAVPSTEKRKPAGARMADLNWPSVSKGAFRPVPESNTTLRKVAQSIIFNRDLMAETASRIFPGKSLEGRRWDVRSPMVNEGRDALLFSERTDSGTPIQFIVFVKRILMGGHEGGVDELTQMHRGMAPDAANIIAATGASKIIEIEDGRFEVRSMEYIEGEQLEDISTDLEIFTEFRVYQANRRNQLMTMPIDRLSTKLEGLVRMNVIVEALKADILKARESAESNADLSLFEGYRLELEQRLFALEQYVVSMHARFFRLTGWHQSDPRRTNYILTPTNNGGIRVRFVDYSSFSKGNPELSKNADWLSRQFQVYQPVSEGNVRPWSFTRIGEPFRIRRTSVDTESQVIEKSWREGVEKDWRKSFDDAVRRGAASDDLKEVFYMDQPASQETAAETPPSISKISDTAPDASDDRRRDESRVFVSNAAQLHKLLPSDVSLSGGMGAFIATPEMMLRLVGEGLGGSVVPVAAEEVRLIQINRPGSVDAQPELVTPASSVMPELDKTLIINDTRSATTGGARLSGVSRSMLDQERRTLIGKVTRSQDISIPVLFKIRGTMAAQLAALPDESMKALVEFLQKILPGNIYVDIEGLSDLNTGSKVPQGSEVKIMILAGEGEGAQFHSAGQGLACGEFDPATLQLLAAIARAKDATSLRFLTEYSGTGRLIVNPSVPLFATIRENTGTPEALRMVQSVLLSAHEAVDFLNAVAVSISATNWTA